MKEIILDEKFFETCGSGSLTGYIYNQLGEIPKELLITFKQTSLKYRKDNNGPKIWMMPEYSIMCFLESILRLKIKGISIGIKELVED